MRLANLTLAEALESAASVPEAAISNTYLFLSRHAYLRVHGQGQTISLVFYQESKLALSEHPADGVEAEQYEDHTGDNLTTTYCPTPNDIIEPKWFIVSIK